MEANSNAAVSDAVRELRLTRTFNAPRDVVFAAWTDPKQLPLWWGPRGFTAPVAEFDPQVGGAIRIDMQGPDGVLYPMAGEVRELDPPQRLVFSAKAMPLPDGSWGFENMNTVIFTAEGNKTRVDLQVEVLYAIPEAAPALSGMREGWGQTLDRLEELVDQDKEAREIVLSRVYDAPRELVWEAWTDARHADKWWGPAGFSNETIEHDFRVGGSWRHIMRGPDGKDYPNRKQYLQITKPERIINTHGWDDDTIPPIAISTITFRDLGEGRTELEMRMTFPTAAERDKLVTEVGAIDRGNETLGRLAEYLSQIQEQGN
jgi:uncharacterized protein YndB with AHSA1/START domain